MHVADDNVGYGPPVESLKILFRAIRNCLKCDSATMVMYSFHV